MLKNGIENQRIKMPDCRQTDFSILPKAFGVDYTFENGWFILKKPALKKNRLLQITFLFPSLLFPL